jgi:hypothetical protein
VGQAERLVLRWAALPSPRSKGQLTPPVCRLVQQVADRAFPGSMRIRTLRGVHGGWTVWAGADGQGRKARGAAGGGAEPAGEAAASAQRD